MNIKDELLQQIRDVDDQITNLENFREELYERYDKELEGE
jgi:hypothetical protein